MDSSSQGKNSGRFVRIFILFKHTETKRTHISLISPTNNSKQLSSNNRDFYNILRPN